MRNGQVEFEQLHHSADQMGEEEFHKVLGALSWKLHPKNEINLYENYLTGAPLVEIL